MDQHFYYWMEFPARVQRSYDALYQQMSKKLEGIRLFTELKEEFYNHTASAARVAFQFYDEAPFDVQLLAALYILVQPTPEDLLKTLHKEITPWQLIHILCFLTSPRGRLFVAGLHGNKISVHRYKHTTSLIRGFLECTLSDCRNADDTSPEKATNVAISAALMDDLCLVTFLENFGLAQRGNETFFTFIGHVLHHAGTSLRPLNSKQYNMQPPRGDVTSLTFRFLTFLKYPQCAGIPGQRLSPLGFTSTCKNDEIRCVICNYSSEDLTGNCDPTSVAFHWDGCSNKGGILFDHNEERVNYRLASFAPLPEVNGLAFASRGLFYLHDNGRVKCYWCRKITDLSVDLIPANCHKQFCPIPGGKMNGQPTILCRTVCCECRSRPADVILSYYCCQLSVCNSCFARLSSTCSHCPNCHRLVEMYCFFYKNS